MKPPQRPVGALVIAILNFVFGGFGLMGVVCIGLEVLGFAILFANMPPPPAPVAGAPARPDPMVPFRELGDGMVAIPGFIPYAVVYAVKGVIAPFLLLISGCVPSLHALYTDQDTIFDRALLGVWTTGNGQESSAFAARFRYALTAHFDRPRAFEI